jgi:hypothetical protein
MAGAVLALPDTAWTRRAGAGVAALWLGLAAMTVVLGDSSTLDLQARISASPPPPHFLAISAGLIFLGIVLPGIAAATTLRRSRELPERVGALVAMVLSAIAIAVLWPLWRTTSIPESLAATLAIAAVALSLAWLGRTLRLGERIRAADRWLGAPSGGSSDQGVASPVGARMVLLVCFVLALIPTIPTLVLGTIATAILLHHGAQLRNELGRLPLLPILCLALLPASWLILTVTGQLAPPLWSLADAPFSPAAELWIAPWLLVAVWALLALWPIHWLVPRPLAACLAGLLLVGVGIYGIPLGLQAFQSWIDPLIVVALWWAVVIRRPELILGALGLFGVLAVPAANAPLLLLPFVLASVLAMPDDWLAIPGPVRLKIGLVMAGGGIWIALLAGLQSQVVYTVLCVAAVATSQISNPPETASGLTVQPGL